MLAIYLSCRGYIRTIKPSDIVIIFGDVSAGIGLTRLGKVACDVPLHAIADNPAFPERTRAPLNCLIFSLIINSAPFYQTLRRQSCKKDFRDSPEFWGECAYRGVALWTGCY